MLIASKFVFTLQVWTSQGVNNKSKLNKQEENLGADKTAESKSGKLTSVDAILIQMSNINLDRRMVLCRN